MTLKMAIIIALNEMTREQMIQNELGDEERAERLENAIEKLEKLEKLQEIIK